MIENANIDLSDIPEVTGKMKARKNPFYERIMKHGFSITETYSPADIANTTSGKLARRIDITILDQEEQDALDRYKKRTAVE